MLIIIHLNRVQQKAVTGAAGQIGSAVGRFNNTLFFKEGEIATDGHFSDSELCGELIDDDFFVLLQNSVNAHSSI